MNLPPINDPNFNTYLVSRIATLQTDASYLTAPDALSRFKFVLRNLLIDVAYNIPAEFQFLIFPGTTYPDVFKKDYIFSAFRNQLKSLFFDSNYTIEGPALEDGKFGFRFNIGGFENLGDMDPKDINGGITSPDGFVITELTTNPISDITFAYFRGTNQKPLPAQYIDITLFGTVYRFTPALDGSGGYILTDNALQLAIVAADATTIPVRFQSSSFATDPVTDEDLQTYLLNRWTDDISINVQYLATSDSDKKGKIIIDTILADLMESLPADSEILNGMLSAVSNVDEFRRDFPFKKMFDTIGLRVGNI